MKEEEFLARVQARADLPSRAEAERWSRAVLTALTHLVSEPEARRHFITQLPGSLKAGLLAETPRSLLMDREAFLQHVGAALGTRAHEAEHALHTVYGVVKEAVSPGEIADFETLVPRDVAAFLARAA